MKKAAARILMVSAIVVPAALAWLWHSVNTIEVHALSENLSLLTGTGGNVAVLKTSVGAVVVDTMMFQSQGRRIRDQIEDITGGKPAAIINTHYHHDHTHGNTGFLALTPVISTTLTRQHLLDKDADYWKGDAASMLPSRTFDGEQVLEIGDKRVRCLWLGRGHTDGDLVVLFEDERVLHAGDLFWNGIYPNVDLEAGGSFKEWIATIDRILALDFDRIIPGHGEISDKEGLRRFQTFLRELWSVAESAARDHKSLAETQKQAALTSEAGMAELYIPFVVHFDHEFVVRRAWEEATGAVPYTPPTPPPAPIPSPETLDRG